LKNISLVGFGRIGRDLFRQSIQENNINIVSVSDVADKDNLVYLLKYDSIYGPLKAEVTETKLGISVNNKETKFNNWKDAEQSDWNSINTDIVVLATGKQQGKEEILKHLDKGAKKIIIASTPKEMEEIDIFVPGANDESIDFTKSIISLGSNTANASAPVIKIINENIGVERAFINTIHGYSNSNRLADVAGKGFRQNRAAGENIIPNKTTSSIVIEKVLPFMKNKITSSSMTVPIPDGSIVDLTIDVKKNTSSQKINEIIEENISSKYISKRIGITYDPIVSSDVVGNSLSGLIDGKSTMDIDKKKIKILIWFDNGWGYSSRILETIKIYQKEDDTDE
jgi:glyceraldehyde 3-phosphate dehydrogenase